MKRHIHGILALIAALALLVSLAPRAHATEGTISAPRATWYGTPTSSAPPFTTSGTLHSWLSGITGDAGSNYLRAHLHIVARYYYTFITYYSGTPIFSGSDYYDDGEDIGDWWSSGPPSFITSLTEYGQAASWDIDYNFTNKFGAHTPNEYYGGGGYKLYTLQEVKFSFLVTAQLWSNDSVYYPNTPHESAVDVSSNPAPTSWDYDLVP